MEPRFITNQHDSLFENNCEFGSGQFYYNGGAAAVARAFDEEDFQGDYHGGEISKKEYQDAVREYQEDYAAANARAMATKAANRGESARKTYNGKMKQYMQKYEESEKEQWESDDKHRKDISAWRKKNAEKGAKMRAGKAAKKNTTIPDDDIDTGSIEEFVLEPESGSSKKRSRSKSPVTTAAKKKNGGRGSSRSYMPAPNAAYRVNRPKSEAPKGVGRDLGDASPELKAAVRRWGKLSKKIDRTGKLYDKKVYSLIDRSTATEKAVEKLAKKENKRIEYGLGAQENADIVTVGKNSKNKQTGLHWNKKSRKK